MDIRIKTICLVLSAFAGFGLAFSASAQPVIPIPVSDRQTTGEFHLEGKPLFYIAASSAYESQVEELSEYLESAQGWSRTTKVGAATFMLTIDRKFALYDKTKSDEAYRLEIAPKKVIAVASSVTGLFYAVQTFVQLTEDYSKSDLTCRVIEDAPRFAYRGFLMDVSRHFRSKEFVKKQIDAMAFFKLNTLHFHLTDGAGWRIQIDKYPRLTEYAAWRPEKTWQAWSENGAHYCEADDPRAQGGFYTKEDIREILEYASQRHITVIPEIEMPGHSEEVLAAYPELGCHEGASKDYDLCPGNEKTFEFLENVLTEVMELFPSEYIHIGGDEAGKGAWRTCEKCRKRMQEENLASIDELQSYMISRMERFLNVHGRSIIGWDEILEGGLAPNATVMSWRGVEGGMKALQSGHKAIMVPGGYCYIDYNQDAPFTQPLSIGGYTPLSKVYSYEPVSEDMTESEVENLLGVQANLWAEWIPTDSHYEYMMWPRLMAIAETGWSKPEYKHYDDFRCRVELLSSLLKQRGYNPFDITAEYGERPESLTPVHHLAEGKPVIYNTPWHSSYPAAGTSTLTDGYLGGWTYGDRKWQGFLNSDVDVVVDLQESLPIHYIGSTFMQAAGPYVWMPKQVEIYVSENNVDYQLLTTVHNDISPKDYAILFKNFHFAGNTSGRYVRIVARNAGIRGGWLFVDEIVVH